MTTGEHGPTWGRRIIQYAAARVRSWRTGSWQSQLYVLMVLAIGVSVSWAISWASYNAMPMASFIVWIVVGGLVLRLWPLAALTAYAALTSLTAMLHDGPVSGPRAGTMVALGLCSLILLAQAGRQRSGLPSALSDTMLHDLRSRLQSQARVPALPGGWRSDSAMIASHGVGYAGDFLVADLADDGRCLEMVLVDVCGKGVAAGAQALHFAGALGGLIGAMDQPGLFHAANAFLLRQHADESFATAVHVRVDLDTGAYTITSAGHPPALRWDLAVEEWVPDSARGMALGILPAPDLDSTSGILRPGEALMFYTDGVVESRADDLDVGITWLRRAGREAIRPGYAGAAARIVKQVRRGDDDRAVLILSRGSQPAFFAAARDTGTTSVTPRESAPRAAS